MKSKKKKLILTSFYHLSQEMWFGHSRKLICTDHETMNKQEYMLEFSFIKVYWILHAFEVMRDSL